MIGVPFLCFFGYWYLFLNPHCLRQFAPTDLACCALSAINRALRFGRDQSGSHSGAGLLFFEALLGHRQYAHYLQADVTMSAGLASSADGVGEVLALQAQGFDPIYVGNGDCAKAVGDTRVGMDIGPFIVNLD